MTQPRDGMVSSPLPTSPSAHAAALVPYPHVATVQARDGLSPGRAALLALLECVESRNGQTPPPVVVLDLDSTLYHTEQRHLAIFSDFIAHHCPENAELKDALTWMATVGAFWNPLDLLEQRGIRDEEVLRLLKRYWRERFFGSDYLRFDQPVAGAPEYVRALHARGAFCYYLTGRAEPSMRAGTVDSLYQHGFPMDSRTTLHMKGSLREDDLLFKTQAVDDVRRLGEVVGVFENEPANINLFHTAFPEAIPVFLETLHSPWAPAVLASVFRVPEFKLEGSL